VFTIFLDGCFTAGVFFFRSFFSASPKEDVEGGQVDKAAGLSLSA
jgi:ABC-type glycerol-3-phosphate transport system permease component